MAHEPVFPHATFKSHMPFFDGRTLVFCRSAEVRQRRFKKGGAIWQALEEHPELRERFAALSRYSLFEYRPWKLAWCDWRQREPRTIVTGLPAEAIECSPAFYRAEGFYQLSFLGGVPREERMEYHLYVMRGPSLEALGPAERVTDEPTRLGFLSPQWSCRSAGPHLRLEAQTVGHSLMLEHSFARLHRMTYCADDPQRLILTGRGGDFQSLSLVHDLRTGTTHEIRLPEPVYKATLWRNRIVFSARVSDELEDFELRHGSYELHPVTVNDKPPRMLRRNTSPAAIHVRPLS